MADTIGSLFDKLATCNQKMFVNQELIYEVRRLSFDEFLNKYFGTSADARRLYEGLQKCCDLNVQRQNLIAEFDRKLVETIRAVVAGKDPVEAGLVQDQHKTY